MTAKFRPRTKTNQGQSNGIQSRIIAQRSSLKLIGTGDELLYADVIGPLPTGRGGFKYIHCIVESLTKLSKTKILKVVDSVKSDRGL